MSNGCAAVCRREALREDDLEDVAGRDVLLGRARRPPVLLRLHVGGEVRAAFGLDRGPARAAAAPRWRHCSSSSRASRICRAACSSPFSSDIGTLAISSRRPKAWSKATTVSASRKMASGRCGVRREAKRRLEEAHDVVAEVADQAAGEARAGPAFRRAELAQLCVAGRAAGPGPAGIVYDAGVRPFDRVRSAVRRRDRRRPRCGLTPMKE